MAETKLRIGDAAPDFELPADYDPSRGAAILACAPGDLARLGSRGFVRIGTVSG